MTRLCSFFAARRSPRWSLRVLPFRIVVGKLCKLRRAEENMKLTEVNRLPGERSNPSGYRGCAAFLLSCLKRCKVVM